MTDKPPRVSSEVKAAIVTAIATVIVAILGIQVANPGTGTRADVPTGQEQDGPTGPVSPRLGTPTSPSQPLPSASPAPTPPRPESQLRGEEGRVPTDEQATGGAVGPTRQAAARAPGSKRSAFEPFELFSNRPVNVPEVEASISATFSVVDTVDYVTLTVAPQEGEMVRAAAYDGGAHITFTSARGSFALRVLAIDWHRGACTVQLVREAA